MALTGVLGRCAGGARLGKRAGREHRARAKGRPAQKGCRLQVTQRTDIKRGIPGVGVRGGGRGGGRGRRGIG